MSTSPTFTKNFMGFLCLIVMSSSLFAQPEFVTDKSGELIDSAKVDTDTSETITPVNTVTTAEEREREYQQIKKLKTQLAFANKMIGITNCNPQTLASLIGYGAGGIIGLGFVAWVRAKDEKIAISGANIGYYGAGITAIKMTDNLIWEKFTRVGLRSRSAVALLGLGSIVANDYFRKRYDRIEMQIGNDYSYNP